MKNYVLGFCFSSDMKQVMLYRKKNTELNGIGAEMVHVNEIIQYSMTRVFGEETHITIFPDKWQMFGMVKNEYYNVMLFKTTCPENYLKSIFDDSKNKSIRLISIDKLDEYHFSENVREMIDYCLSENNEMFIINKNTKDIDNVTVKNLGFVLQKLNISIPDKILDVIIDVVEILEETGDLITTQNIQELKENHEINNINYNYFGDVTNTLFETKWSENIPLSNDFHVSSNVEFTDINKPIFTIGIPIANKPIILEIKKHLGELFGSDCYIICYYTTNVEPIFNFYGEKELSGKNYIQEINKIIDNLNQKQNGNTRT